MANNNAPSPDDDGSSKTKMTLSLKSSGTGCNALVRKEVVEYWKSCSVLERISLTTIDKTTIIRKLKQRHKHRCSCENCMRRRVPYFDDEVHFYDQIVSILEKRDLETIDWDFEEKLQLPFCCHHAKDHQEQNDDNKEITSNEEEQSGIFLIFGQKLYIEEGMLKIHPKALAKQDLLLTILEKLKRVVEENHNMCEEQGKKEKNRTCEMCSACIAFEFLVCKAIVEKVSSAYNHRLAVMKAEQMVQVLLKEEQQKSKQKLKKKKKKKTKKRDQDNDEDEEDDDSNSVATMDSLNQFMNDDPVFGSLEDDNGSESSLMDYENGSSPTDLSQDIDDSFDVSSEHGDPFQDLLEFREKWEVVSKPRKVKQAPNPPSTSTPTSLPQSQVLPKTTSQPVPSRQNRKHQSKLVLPPRLQQQLLNSSQHQNRVQNYVPKESPVPEVSIPSATVFATQVFHTTIPFSGQYHTSCFSLPTIFGQYNSTPLYASWVMNTSSDSSSSANSNRSDSLYFGILV